MIIFDKNFLICCFFLFIIKMSYDVAVLGSFMVDLISYVDKIPKVGETVHANAFNESFGGKGANQLIAATRLGSKTLFVGKLGNDSFGNKYLEHFRSEGVNTDFVEQCKDSHTGIAQIIVSETGENQIVINAGANINLKEEDYMKAKPVLDNCKILICQLETPIAATLKALADFKGISILNAAPAMKLPKEIFSMPSIFCVNELEAEEITGICIDNFENAKKCIIRLQEMGCKTVIVTLGVGGAAFNSVSGQIFRVPVESNQTVVDTTGAGDCFIGALAHFIAKYPEVEMTQKIAASCVLASHSVTLRGTQISYVNFPTIDFSSRKFAFEEL